MTCDAVLIIDHGEIGSISLLASSTAQPDDQNAARAAA
jgi:hypothetical protein